MSQKTYMCILRSASGGCESDKPSPSDMEQMFASYQAWQDKFADNILDMGGKLGEASSIITKEGVSDGPFVELKEIIGGYMLIQANDQAEATEVITASPMIQGDGISVEVRKIQKP